jgi:hypothetical protein
METIIGRLRPVVVSLALCLALALAGCGGEKKEAVEGIAKVTEICKGNDMEAAKKLVGDLRAKNTAFKDAWDSAVEGVAPEKVNYCSITTHMQVKARLEW